MKTLELDENLQPVWTGVKDYSTIDGVEALEQIVRLKSINRTYNISSQYQDSLIPQKIEKEIREIARELDFINSVVDITVTREKNNYSVQIKMDGSEDFNIYLDNV